MQSTGIGGAIVPRGGDDLEIFTGQHAIQALEQAAVDLTEDQKAILNAPRVQMLVRLADERLVASAVEVTDLLDTYLLYRAHPNKLQALLRSGLSPAQTNALYAARAQLGVDNLEAILSACRLFQLDPADDMDLGRLDDVIQTAARELPAGVFEHRPTEEQSRRIRNWALSIVIETGRSLIGESASLELQDVRDIMEIRDPQESLEDDLAFSDAE
ncbi:hypothetical protein HY346_02550 [Candidatus Microgenomates bacterium]|nr:hypothetical protein [Candidatus Microgenomates bacterium]